MDKATRESFKKPDRTEYIGDISVVLDALGSADYRVGQAICGAIRIGQKEGDDFLENLYNIENKELFNLLDRLAVKTGVFDPDESASEDEHTQ